MKEPRLSANSTHVVYFVKITLNIIEILIFIVLEVVAEWIRWQVIYLSPTFANASCNPVLEIEMFERGQTMSVAYQLASKEGP